MFKCAHIFAICLFALTAVFLATKVLIVTPKIREEFQALKTQHKKSLTAPITEQRKVGVQKDIFYTRDLKRTQNCIKAKRGVFRAIPIGKRYELIEHLSRIECYMQASLSENGQTIRLIKSPEGTYFYNTNEFQTSKAAMHIYRLLNTS